MKSRSFLNRYPGFIATVLFTLLFVIRCSGVNSTDKNALLFLEFLQMPKSSPLNGCGDPSVTELDYAFSPITVSAFPNTFYFYKSTNVSGSTANFQFTLSSDSGNHDMYVSNQNVFLNLTNYNSPYDVLYTYNTSPGNDATLTIPTYSLNFRCVAVGAPSGGRFSLAFTSFP